MNLNHLDVADRSAEISASLTTLEARVSADLRLVWIETEGETIFALLGGHDEVQRFLKNL